MRRPTDLRRRCTRPWGIDQAPSSFFAQNGPPGWPISTSTTPSVTRYRSRPALSLGIAASLTVRNQGLPFDAQRRTLWSLAVTVTKCSDCRCGAHSRVRRGRTQHRFAGCADRLVGNVERRRLVEELDQGSLRRPLRYIGFPAVGCRPVQLDGVTGLPRAGLLGPDLTRGGDGARCVARWG